MNTLAFRLTALITGLLVGLGLLAPTAAQADDLAPYPASYDWSGSVGYFNDDEVVGFTLNVKNALPDTTATVVIQGCPGLVMKTTQTSASGGDFDVYSYLFEVRNRLGANLPFTVTYSAPGYSPVTRDGVAQLRNPTAGEQHCAGDPCSCTTPPTVKPSAKALVNSWSVKHGKAKIGRTLWVTPTRVKAGTHVSYRWYVNGKALDRDRTLKVKRTMKGKRPSVVITISKNGYKPFQKTLSYQAVR